MKKIILGALVVVVVVVVVVGSSNAFNDAEAHSHQDPLELLVFPDSSTSNSTCNCSTTESPLMFHPLNGNEGDARLRIDDLDDFDNEETAFATASTPDPLDTDVSHLKPFSMPKDWETTKPTLNFPKTPPEERFKMASLHLDKGIFVFDFLQGFLSTVQPHDIPLDLMRDVAENRISFFKLLSESMHMEVGFVALVGVCCILACVIPGTELWLACRPIREDYKPSQHPGFLAFLLSVSVFILGSCMFAMLVCNQASSSGIEKIPLVVETALQDLSDYHSRTTAQMRSCLTRSLDVACEAILADLDNVEELLGKPVQVDLATETGLDVALEALLDVANASQDLSSRANALLKEGDRASERGLELSREVDVIRRELEAAVRDCPSPDRPLCATLNPTGLGVALRLDMLLRDERLLRLRGSGRENLTEAARQARGEYLYVPHHVARNTLDIRNRIRREISVARSKIFEEARSIESKTSDLSKQLESTRKITNFVVPYITSFEENRWFVGIGTILAVFLVWIFVVGALCCRCGSSEHRVRSTLLCGVLTSCVVSIGLWAVLVCALAVSSHTEMLLCRPLHDPEYRTLETILESKLFLGKRMGVPLKDLFEKCEQNQAAYPAFQLGNSMKLEQLTAYWTWTGLSSSLSRLRVDLKGLRILTPSFQEKLQTLLYACGANLTEHKTMIRGPILNKDLNALSDQVYNVARQLTDRRVARNLEDIGSTIRVMMVRRLNPLMKIQSELVDRLTALELHLQPLQRQVNQSISHLKTIQYYIDNQGANIAAMKSKKYAERLSGYLDLWRVHVLSEMGTGVAKCRPLWEILRGLRLLLCQHILGPMNGFWFVTLVCAVVMMISTPVAHTLASVYKKESCGKDLSFLPSRTGSPDTVIIDRNSWRTPDPPPRQDSW